MIIGGHKGLRVERDSGVITKRAHKDDGEEFYKIALQSIKRSAAGLRVMARSGFTPNLIEQGKEFVVQTDLGNTEKAKEEQTFRRNCVRMLYEIRRRGWRHGDLTDRNIIVKDDYPWLIDWQESHKIGQKAPKKHPLSDSALLFRCLGDWKDATGIIDPSRITRRWRAILMALDADKNLALPLKDKTFLDLGCFQGDHVAMARAELMEAEGIDHGGFRGGEDSIDIAEDLWQGMGCKFAKANIFDLPESYFERDVVAMFSTFAWMTEQQGGEAAKTVVETIIKRCGVLFFESQLWGDGPGPSWFPNDNHIAGMMKCLGAKVVKSLVTIPVYGRNASRTVWEIRQ